MHVTAYKLQCVHRTVRVYVAVRASHCACVCCTVREYVAQCACIKTFHIPAHKYMPQFLTIRKQHQSEWARRDAAGITPSSLPAAGCGGDAAGGHGGHAVGVGVCAGGIGLLSDIFGAPRGDGGVVIGGVGQSPGTCDDRHVFKHSATRTATHTATHTARTGLLFDICGALSEKGGGGGRCGVDAGWVVFTATRITLQHKLQHTLQRTLQRTLQHTRQHILHYTLHHTLRHTLQYRRRVPQYYGVATISRLLKMLGLFCRIQSLL